MAHSQVWNVFFFPKSQNGTMFSLIAQSPLQRKQTSQNIWGFLFPGRGSRLGEEPKGRSPDREHYFIAALWSVSLSHNTGILGDHTRCPQMLSGTLLVMITLDVLASHLAFYLL